MKATFFIFADMKSFLYKLDTCHNNPEKSSTAKINKRLLLVILFFSCCSFNATKHKHSYYSEKGCMKIFCKDLREHATKIISYEKKK